MRPAGLRLLRSGQLAVVHGTGTWRLDLLDPADGRLLPLDPPYDRRQPAMHVMGSLHGVDPAGCGPTW